MMHRSKRLKNVQGCGSDAEDDSDIVSDELPIITEEEGEEGVDGEGEEMGGELEDQEELEDGEEEVGEEELELNDEEVLNNGEEEKDGVGDFFGTNNDEMEKLEMEYMDLRHQEQNLLKNLKQYKDEDVLKGQAVKNQRSLWDKTLEFRFLLQKAFSNSNRLPLEPIRSLFLDSDEEVNVAYSNLVSSSVTTLDSLFELQKALLEKNPSITPASNGNSNLTSKQSDAFANGELDEEWLQVYQMHSRIAPFRDKSVDKWQRKTQVTTGAAAMKGKLQAFNQNISDQVAAYMRDTNRMIKGMQQRRSMVHTFGAFEQETGGDGDPELLDDGELYQQLLKEFFETIDPASSETAFYTLKRLQTKKRKMVDRRASKSRKIRYHVHEKIVSFMAPRPMKLPPMAPKLFENLFGLKGSKTGAI